MRYYKIELKDANGNPLVLSSLANSGMPPGVITSLNADGTTNPNALNIELDITQYPGHSAGGDSRSYVRIWGLSLSDIRDAYSYKDGTITVSAGMAKGLPLANPNQQGVLVTGSILQAFGNWLGVDMTLDLIIGPAKDTPAVAANFAFHWEKGEKLKDLVDRVLKQATPNLDITVNINDNRVAPMNYDGQYQTLTQFAQLLYWMTKTEGKEDGVVILLDGKKVVASEHPTSQQSIGATDISSPTQIDFNDLLGQVTWYGPLQITAKLVMRGNLAPMQVLKFPPGLVSSVTAASMPAYGGAPRDRDNLGFSGTYQILQMQHWGNFRQPDGLSWNTTIWCYQNQGGPSQPTSTSNGSSNGSNANAGAGP